MTADNVGASAASEALARHIPVMLAQVLEAAAPLAGALVCDGTFGAGGYTRAMLEAGAQVIAIDRDPDAAVTARGLAEEFGGRFRFEPGTLGQQVFRDRFAPVAAKYGMLVNETAPVTAGYVDPGKARVVITRASATVEGCPDWSDSFAANLGNETRSGFGCAVNSNIAAMVANPEHLLKGATGTGETVIMSSSKAIESYRAQEPTGKGGLKTNSTGGGN